MKKLRIKVTQNHIDKAIKEINKQKKKLPKGENTKNGKCCPIFFALKGTILNDKEVCADVIDVAKIGVGRYGSWINLPIKIKNFIADFDSGKKVKPQSFVLLYDPCIL